MLSHIQCKGIALITLLLVNAVFSTPLMKRDLSQVSDTAIAEGSDGQRALLLDEDVFGGHEEGDGSGAREKRLLQLKAFGLGAGLKAAGAGLKAAGAGVKAIGVSAAKAVGKKALTAGVAVGAKVAKGALTVGATVAKAAITVGIAKLLLSLVFGKINQLLALKASLVGGKAAHGGLFGSSSLPTSGLSGGSSSSDGQPAPSDGDVPAGIDVDSTTEALPEIDPEKVSLQVPDEIISGGFNVVNKAAPVVGDVIQRTAERVVRLVGGLKPIFGSSVGFKTFKRNAVPDTSETPPDTTEQQQFR
ncbi:uncharacterized protein [Halyomorpha halys]|uniref:uncharacterized protein n=1 Tax=Halyomorpha halys TaxID=286706 RepID=UPI0006D506F6|nr:uncharacterized protein LOC106692764 [Halyomorpha halys]XP_014294377.1 uncharacterized protein LOC106692764 [Halyomorpha halys]